MTKNKIKLTVPEDLDFAALRLSRDTSTGGVVFDWAPIERLCAHNGLDIEIFRARHEDNVAGLIITWYAAHRAHGGAPDAVAEELIAETHIEDEHGGGISHPTGRG